LSSVAGSVVVAIKAVDEASSVFGKIQASMGVLGGTLSQLGGGFAQVGSVVSGFAAGGVAGAAVAGLGQIISGLQWATGEAAKNQQAWTDLQASLKLTGPAWDTAKTAIDSFASSLQKTTVFEDEAIVGAVQKLATFGMSYTQAMDAVKVAVDLAAAKHIDLETATGLVGKAFMGNTAILARYGIDVTTAKEASAGLKDAIGGLADGLKAMGPDLGAVAEYLTGAGISLTDSAGKMRDFKDIATDLVGALQEGKISAADFASIQANLGTSIDTSKLKVSDYTGVLSQLNEQFGGTAVAQAQTYAGAQERLKNAMSDMGEKIGGILLPALAGMTEAMIPIVDSLTSGVAAVQNWITEVGKMPEVKGAVDAAGEAFAGLQKWFGDVAQVAMETLGPALKELMSAFGEIWDALKPLGEAFGEIIAALTDGEGSGDLFKAILLLIVDAIKGLAAGIRVIAPLIKDFAEAFKSAAEFITPFLVTIRDAVTGFLEALRGAFEAFYNFLVGHSLWQDLWNSMVSVVQNFGTLIGAAIQAAFAAWNVIIEGGMMLLSTVLTTGFRLALAAVQTIVEGGMSIIQSLINTVTQSVTSTATAWNDFVKNVQTMTASVKKAIDDLVAMIKIAAGTIQSTWSSTLQAMAAETRSTFNQIVADISAAVDAIIAKLKWAQATIAAHSIWPDMLGSMVDQTKDAMRSITGQFDNLLSMPGEFTPEMAANLRGNRDQAAGSVGPLSFSAEIPLTSTIMIDGEQVAAIITRNSVRQQALQRAVSS